VRYAQLEEVAASRLTLILAYNCSIGYTKPVNFNVYLDRDSADRLNRLARKTGTPRNALVRQAVRTWLDQNAAAWPKEVLEFGAEPSLVPFEAHRAELAPASDDPFGSSPRPGPSRRRGPRRKGR